MATKLINSRRLGIIIMIGTIVAVTVAVMALYPWFRVQAYADAVKISDQMADEASAGGYYALIGNVEYLFPGVWRVKSLAGILMLAAGAAAALVSLAAGLSKKIRLAERKIFAVPFEFLLLAAYIIFGCMEQEEGVLPVLLWLTVTGELADVLMQQLYLDAGLASAAAMCINVAAWGLFVTFICWITVSAASVFVLGTRRWFWKRTLTGRVIFRIRISFQKLCLLIQSVDFRQKPTRLILRIVAINFGVLTVLSCFWFYGIFGLVLYSAALFFLLRRFCDDLQKKYGILLAATEKIAQGNLEVEIQEDLGIFQPLKEEIAKVQNGFKRAVEEEVRSRSMKTELITNVSHDLKTPLTAIITYVNLLKKPDITEQEREDYVQVLDRKSMRLKSLIEDLFEISKANSNNVTLNLMDVDVVSLMKQVSLELDDKIRSSGIDFRFNLPKEKVILSLDSEKTYRIFENLLVNIVKYGLPGTRAYVEIHDDGDRVSVLMKNISAAELTLEGRDLTERFVRGDASRNTEGAGLGLAIAASFMKLQKGQMDVDVEADLFKVSLVWKRDKKDNRI